MARYYNIYGKMFSECTARYCSCLDFFSDGHFKLLHMKIGSKIKKLRNLVFTPSHPLGGHKRYTQ